MLHVGAEHTMPPPPGLNFIHRSADVIRPHVDEAIVSGDVVRLERALPRPHDQWVVRTFVFLRRLGIDADLSGEVAYDRINLLDQNDIDLCRAPSRAFLVTIRADRDPSFVSAMEIVQNNSSVWSRRNVFVPHWPQPGLLPRDPTRGMTVRRVAYFGKADNLAPEFRDGDFRAELDRIGIEFVVRERSWDDYRDVDVILAIRAGSRSYTGSKPASKLVNAWIAGCPAILGPEHGFMELRRDTLDFLSARTVRGAIEHLQFLKDHPETYAAMVHRGRARAAAWSTDRVAEEWCAVLRGPIARQFAIWRKRPEMERRLYVAAGRVRRSVWGWQVNGGPKSTLRLAVDVARRAVVLPRSTMLRLRPIPEERDSTTPHRAPTG